jgi:biopolymer transport protein TolR
MSMSTGSSGGSGMGSLTEINVTPLVDVMLVLLIIFMVTAPMIQTGVDVNLPQAKAQTIPDDEGKLILTVTKDKRVFLGKLQIPWDDVEKTLKNNAKLNADHELYLHADKDLLYGDVVKIMAVVKQAGVDKLGMVTDPLE